VYGCTCVEDPMNRYFSEDILVVPNEVDLLPHVAEETINVALAEVGCALELVGAENSYREMHNPTLLVGIPSVDEGGAIVPLQVKSQLPQLVLDYVEVAAVGPVVPKVHHLEGAAIVHEHHRVKLVRPRSQSWVSRF
jgi:hypothetical protein